MSGGEGRGGPSRGLRPPSRRWRGARENIVWGCVLAALLFLATIAGASELTVDKRTVALDDTIVITVSLNDAFAGLDLPSIPLRNLKVDGQPSVASSFQWINGQSSRQKIVRFNAHPLVAGEAIVGPVVLRAGRQVETLPAIALQVVPDRTTQLTDPAAILRELVESGRDPIFVAVDADRSRAFAGEEVVVTWTLYNATNVQQYSMVDVPKLDDFWTEEVRVANTEPVDTRLGGMVVQKLVIRRAALFPLRSGTLTVPPMTVAAAVLRRSRTPNVFGEYEGTVTEVRRRSPAVTIESRPIPPGPPVDVVGDVDIQCSTPMQKNGGPVVIEVAVKGRANLRGIEPPRFAQPIDGTLQVGDARLAVDSSHDDATMTRSWRYLLFPSRSGFMTIPPLVLRTLTSAGERRELRCEQRLVEVTRATAEPPPPPTTPKTFVSSVRRAWIPAAIAGLLVIVMAIVAPRIRSTRGTVRDVSKILHTADADIPASIETWLRERDIEPSALLLESSDRGDAYRALRSLLDGMRHERIETSEAELRQRVRDLVIAVSK